jgi:predicted AlkP superfamily phosphohydrolase/phosphomutase
MRSSAPVKMRAMPTTPNALPRQLLIGIDAMEWTLVRDWAAEGRLPAFRRLIEEGALAQLASPAHALPDMSWSTFALGVNPGKIEKYFYVQYDAGQGRLRYADDQELRGTPFWEYLARAGRKTAVIDLPHLPLRPLPGGCVVMNWGAHDNKGGLATQPATLRSEILQRHGDHPVLDCERYPQSATERSRLHEDLLRGVRAHGELFRWVLSSQSPEVMVCSFSAAHCGGHHFWHERERIQQLYEALDRELGELIATAGSQMRVLVFALHGMGELAHASWSLNEILELLGFGAAPPAAAGARPGRTNFWRRLKMVLPPRLQYRIRDTLPTPLRDLLLARWYAGKWSVRGRRAFAVPNNDSCGAVRINLRGRDREGIVEPSDYERICDDLAAALLELVDPVSGRRVVRSVTRLQHECHGPNVDRLPDLGIGWENGFHWEAVRSPRFGTLAIPKQDLRSGSHTTNSFLLATGPGIARGARLGGGSTLDIAPTVLQLAGVPIPAEFDGKPLGLLAQS